MKAWQHGAGLVAVGCIAMFSAALTAEPHHDHHAHAEHGEGHNMTLDREGMTMYPNADTLPRDCDDVSAEIDFEVRVGRSYAVTGRTFGYNQHEWRVPPCSRVTVTLINEDSVRHQWMVHGLPRYLHPHGMFHLETSGGARRQGTLIVPSDARTYLVHCDISHHMEQGLKAQLVVGDGEAGLPGIPGLTAPRFPDRY